MEIIEIKYITREGASKIIETGRPTGLFYEIDGDLHVGIDNRSGDAWVEEFKTKEECLNWLRGDREGTSEEKEEYLIEQRVGFRGMAEHWVCPNCGRIYWFKEYIENYCGSCGQKLTVD